MSRTVKALRSILAGALVVGAPALVPLMVPLAVAQVVVSPVAVEAALAAGQRAEVSVAVTNTGAGPLALYAVPQPPESGPSEPWGTVLFSTSPGTTNTSFGLTLTPNHRLFAVEYSGGTPETREFTADLALVRTFEDPRGTFSPVRATGLAWMPPEHAPPGHPEGTLWWLYVDVDCDGPNCTVTLARLVEGDLDGNETGRTVEAVTGPAVPGPPALDRGTPFGLAYDAEAANGAGLFYYLDVRNNDVYALGLDGAVAAGYPVPQSDYDPGGSDVLGGGSLDASRGADGGMYLEAEVPVLGVDTAHERIVVMDRDGTNTGVETPLTRIEPPDGIGELLNMNGAMRSRLDPSILYLSVYTGDFGQGGDHTVPWVLAVRAAPLPPRWLRASAAAPAALDIAPGATDTLTVRLDAEGLAVGDYAGRVLLRRDGPNGEDVVEVPVALTVTQGTAGEEEAESPEVSSLAVYPNPTTASAMVAFTLATASDTRVAVYDVLGREVAVLHDGPLVAGTHQLPLDAAGLPAGFYLVRAESDGYSTAHRMTVLR